MRWWYSNCAALLTAAFTVCATAGEVEVLHWWTSGGEAKSVQVLKATLAEHGHQWRDFAVAGGGGVQAMETLRARVISGHSPAAAQINGTAIRDWAKLNALANLDDVAREQQWDVRLIGAIAELMKVDGHYVAAPFNVHRVNWLWINRHALLRVGGRTPHTWDDFFALADKFQKAGIVPLAHGGQPWQELNTFETVVLGVGGADFYRRAFVQVDPDALRSDAMARSLATFRRLKSYTDPKSLGRDWNVATGMVVKGDAGMQMMGDWAKGEFIAAGMQPERDFICVSAPGTERAYSFVVDSFAMFKLKDAGAIAAQKDLARTIMSPSFQEVFNLNKGSIPVASGANLNRFDHCAQESSAYFVATSMIHTLVPSVTHKMGTPERTVAVFRDVVSEFWNRDAMTIQEAMDKLAAAPR